MICNLLISLLDKIDVSGTLFMNCVHQFGTTKLFKVSQKAMIRNRYNRGAHLIQATLGESVKKHRKHLIQKSPDVSVLPMSHFDSV